eukprot:scaffold3953_cov169-Amphora_coffeaeformis.AAC.4
MLPQAESLHETYLYSSNEVRFAPPKSETLQPLLGKQRSRHHSKVCPEVVPKVGAINIAMRPKILLPRSPDYRAHSNHRPKAFRSYPPRR